MESHADLGRFSVRKLKSELRRLEECLDALRTAFPPHTDGTVSLTSQYGDGGPVGRKFDQLNRDIAAIRLELIERGKWTRSAKNKGEVAFSKRGDALQPSRNHDPEVAKRRMVVKSDRYTRACELCEIFDRQKVPIPVKWREAGLKSWGEAYRNTIYRKRIDVLIAKDKKSS